MILNPVIAGGGSNPGVESTTDDGVAFAWFKEKHKILATVTDITTNNIVYSCVLSFDLKAGTSIYSLLLGSDSNWDYILINPDLTVQYVIIQSATDSGLMNMDTRDVIFSLGAEKSIEDPGVFIGFNTTIDDTFIQNVSIRYYDLGMDVETD